MRIAVASGKGGTGKTTVATSLALSLARDSRNRYSLIFLDCDVEAPNAHLFLHPRVDQRQAAEVLIPVVDQTACTTCGKCVEVCQFHALALIGKKVLVFPQLCHGCGSCTWNCPEKAITEFPNPIGQMEAGMANGTINFARGILTISEPMPTPIIRQLKHWQFAQQRSPGEQVMIFDAPPGASCSVVETIRGSDFILLVSEPSPFGLHDLQRTLGMLQHFKVSALVVINKADLYPPGASEIHQFAEQKQIEIIGEVPYDQAIIEAMTQGLPVTAYKPDAAASKAMRAIWQKLAAYVFQDKVIQ